MDQELGQRFDTYPPSTRIRGASDNLGHPIVGRRDVVSMVRALGDPSRAKVMAIYLTDGHHVISYEVVAIGFASRPDFDAPWITRNAVLIGAAKLILARNAAAGRCTPDSTDHEQIERLRAAARIMRVELLDFLVIGHQDPHADPDSPWEAISALIGAGTA